MAYSWSSENIDCGVVYVVGSGGRVRVERTVEGGF